MTRSGNATQGAVAWLTHATAAAFAVHAGWYWMRVGGVVNGTPGWDPAAHGLAGVQLADALRRLDLVGFLGALLDMRVWPPLFALLESAVFLVFGYDFTVASTLVSVLAAACVLAVYGLGVQVQGLWTGAAAAALVAVSPLFGVFANLVMIEMLGVLLSVLAATSYVIYLRSGWAKAWTACCACTMLLFFCKYNYAVLWGATLWLATFLARPEFRQGVMSRLRAAPARWVPRSAFGGVVAAWFVLLAWIALAGGWSGEVLGQRVSIRSLGNPTAGLVLLLLLRAAFRPRRSLAALRNRWERLSPAGRTLVGWCVVPVLWLVLPGHLKGFFELLENRSSDFSRWSAAGLLFYPRAIVRDYAATGWIGGVMLLGFASSLWRCRGFAAWARLPVVAALVGLIAGWLHPYKEARFLITAVPFLFVAAAQGLAWPGKANTGVGRRMLPALLAIAVLGLGLLPSNVSRQAEVLRPHTEPAAIREVLDAVVAHAPAQGRVAVLPTRRWMNPSLLEWQAFRAGRQDSVGARVPLVVDGVPRLSVPHWRRDIDPEQLVQQLVDDANVTGILLIESQDLTEAWLARARAALARQEIMPLVYTQYFAGSSHQLSVYERGGTRVN